MLRRLPTPPAAREAYYFVEMETKPGVEELENMPQLLVEQILAYKMVRNIVIYGGVLVL